MDRSVYPEAIKEVFEIYRNTREHQIRADKLFEYCIDLIEPLIKASLPTSERMLILAKKKLAHRGITAKIKDNTFKLNWHVNAGCSGDWEESETLTPLLFFFKFLY